MKPTAKKMKNMILVLVKTKINDTFRLTFMFLCRLNVGFSPRTFLSDQIFQSLPRAEKILTWKNYLYFILGSTSIWATREQIVQNMPQEFNSFI